MLHNDTAGLAAPGELPGEAPWHTLTAEEALRRLGSGPGGLNAEEAACRLASHGPNRLPAAKPRGALHRLLAQFHDLLIHVLLASAGITAALGHWIDAGVILGVVLINAAVGFVQEGRAEQALDAIRSMLTPRASVLRDGRRLTVDAAGLVPGDLVLLEAGDKVPADLRLTRARGMRVEEAALIGSRAKPQAGGAARARSCTATLAAAKARGAGDSSARAPCPGRANTATGTCARIICQRSQRWNCARLSAPISQTKRTPG